MVSNADLLQGACIARRTGLDASGITEYLAATPGWTLDGSEAASDSNVDADSESGQGKEHIAKSYRFQDFRQTMAFVDAIADVIHREDHHPELEISYNRCTVKYRTHSVDNPNGVKGGLSENDFICAAKIDALFEASFRQSGRSGQSSPAAGINS